MPGQADDLPIILYPVPNPATCVLRTRLAHENKDWEAAALGALDCMHHMRSATGRAAMFALAAEAFRWGEIAAEVRARGMN